MSDIEDTYKEIEAYGILIDIEILKYLNEHEYFSKGKKFNYIYFLTSNEYSALVNDRNNIRLYELYQTYKFIKSSFLNK